jgi:hypothetical protein
MIKRKGADMTINLPEINHCKDCCCAKSWEALGIKEYTGLSIYEHISEMRKELNELKYGSVFKPKPTPVPTNKVLSVEDITDIAYKSLVDKSKNNISMGDLRIIAESVCQHFAPSGRGKLDVKWPEFKNIQMGHKGTIEEVEAYNEGISDAIRAFKKQRENGMKCANCGSEIKPFNNKDGLCSQQKCSDTKEVNAVWVEDIVKYFMTETFMAGNFISNTRAEQMIRGIVEYTIKHASLPSGNSEVVDDMLLRAYMDANKIPYQTVGDSNIENIKKYLCEKKIMPAHLMPKYIVEKYGLIDNQPSVEEAEKETKRLQELANEKRKSLKGGQK